MSYEELLEAHERDVTRVLDLLVRHKLTGSSDKATIAVSEVVFAGPRSWERAAKAHTWQSGRD